jgi:hypothetical protein
MDILASMLAYLVCVCGIVTGLALSFAVYFGPVQQTATPGHVIAMVAEASAPQMARASTIKPAGGAEPAERKVAAKAKPDAVPMIAIDARQKPLFSQSRLRRLAAQQRARHLAYRERSSFESRFLHYDD